MTAASGAPCALVVTTVNHPTAAVQALARDRARLNASLILVGDEKSPPDFHQPGAIYLSLEAQAKLGFKLALQQPTKHYARKNIGYLEAIRRGAGMIVETDDDNLPLEAFWQPRSLHATAPVLRDAGWVNVYRYFTTRHVWPRGLPLEEVRRAQTAPSLPASEAVSCPIQQGLADGDPDVDAVWRLVGDNAAVAFNPGRQVALAAGAWCPFNSQNTTWWPLVFPLLYLPSHCSFRMTDIWRSFVAQRISAANGWGLLFTSPTVMQIRNEHDLMRDFAEEVPGYLGNAAIRRALEAVEVRPGPDHMAANLVRCYERLVAIGIMGAAELVLLDTWLEDLAACRSCAPDGGQL